MEEALDKSFLPPLFKGTTAEVLSLGITRLPVKQAGLEIPNLTLSAWENWTDSCVVTGHLITALHRRTEFKTGDHSMILWEG